jgi:FkbM family methyltransferase
MAAQNNIDNIVLDIFGNNKVFVEAGGSHPIDQNNTFLLERNGWSGLIIEPKKEFNDMYSSIRPRTILENYVLVSKDYNSDEIEGDFSHYMIGGIINNNLSNFWNPKKHKCKTLESLLLKHNIEEVHFLSLDVEGYENEVIDGINFESVFIHLIILEIHNFHGTPTNFEYIKKYGFEKLKSIGNNHHEVYVNVDSEFYENAIKKLNNI